MNIAVEAHLGTQHLKNYQAHISNITDESY